MWILQGSAAETDEFTFRLSAGAVKTIGRAPRADFIVDAALVSRLHCRLERAKTISRWSTSRAPTAPV